MKKTAVEWLRDLYENRPAYEECILEDEWEEALKMEKEIMCQFQEDGQSTDFWVKYDSWEDCFDKTFNTNKK
jgi:hypothetical protein